MKTHFIFLCLIVSGGFVHATTQTKADPDKPARLYVKTYTDTEDGSQASTDTYQDASGNATGEWDSYVETGNTSGSWSDNGGGSSSWTWQGIYAASHVPIGTNYAWYDVVYQTNAYPDIGVASVNASDDDLDTPFTVNMEHCDLDVPLIDTSGSYLQNMGGGNFDYQTEKDTGSRHAQATMILQTGGKAVSRQENLFCLGATAAQILCVKTPIPVWANPPPPAVPPVLPQNIQIMGESLDTNGNLYVVLPDNDTLDVTPQLQGVDYYTFTENQQKYTLTITANNTNLSNSILGGQPEFCVGQQVTMAVNWQPALPSAVWVNYNWVFQPDYINQIVDQGTNQSPLETINVGLKTNNPTSLWWYGGGVKLAGCNITLSTTNGQPIGAISPNGFVSIYSPQVQFPLVAIQPMVPMLTNSLLELGVALYGYGAPSFSARITSKTNFPGVANWVQLINRSGTSQFQTTSGQYWLDNDLFYNTDGIGGTNIDASVPNGGISFDDHPRVGTTSYGIPYPYVSINDSFETYLVFKPTDDTAGSSIWVTLGVVDWGWAASETLNLSLTSSTNAPPIYSITNAFPRWPSVLHNN